MTPSILNPQQLRTALLKCSVQLSAVAERALAANPAAITIGQAQRAEFHDIVVHALNLLRVSLPDAASYRTMITRAYAGSVHLPEGAPRIDAVRAIAAVLNTVATTLASARDVKPDSS